MYSILVCDDEKDIVSALKIYLMADGYQVFEAYNGKEALEVLKEQDIHLVLMDIMMPEMDGIAAMVKIRETSNVPVILLTAKSEDTDKVLGLTVGADDYITKPFNAEYLRISVCQMLERKEVLKDYFSSAISSFEKTDGKLTHKESKKFQQSVLKIINDHIQEKELTPRFIADHLAISVRSLYRKMEEMGEESPTIMIKECRLHVAKDLLLKTKKTIDEIVFEAGFSNKVTFFKVFREKYGCTPKEFRTKHLEEVQ